MNLDTSKAPKEVKNAANYLRSDKSGLKIRQGVLNGKRVEYFKGKGLVNALLRENYAKHTPKTQPPLTTREEAQQFAQQLLLNGFFLRIDRGGTVTTGVRQVSIAQEQMMSEDMYYVWLYEGSQLFTYLASLGLLAAVLAAVLFPLWPSPIRVGVWYISIGMLFLIGLFFVIAIIRLILYIITLIVAPPGIWIFPNLFEDVGIIESFIPLWAWDEPKKKKEKGGKKAGASSSAEGEGEGTGGAREGEGEAASEKHEGEKKDE
ncbi:uncharacterized protein VTP21DRAFT_7476 [Calcarisporiella thermophila]|uniref:uncharacterized protein n=1 Tax=Calcarisporiella thermophila TaxID=911321 RepID=UPI0037445A19